MEEEGVGGGGGEEVGEGLDELGVGSWGQLGLRAARRTRRWYFGDGAVCSPDVD